MKLLLGQASIPLSFERNLSQYGGEVIKNITVCRDPIQSVISSVLNAVTGGDLEKRLESRGYDELYHLYAILTTESGLRFRLEKNQRPILELDNSGEAGDCVYVEKNIGETLATLIRKTVSSMGVDRFVRYDPIKNNCQDFLTRFLSSNGLLTPSLREFIKQDAEDLLGSNVQTGAKALTDIAGVASDISDILEENKNEPVVQAILTPVKRQAGDWAQSLSDLFVKGVSDVFSGLTNKGTSEPDIASLLHKDSGVNTQFRNEITEEDKNRVD